MTSPFAFHGRIGRLPYALGSAAAFFSQHLATWAVLKSQGITLLPDLWFAFVPLRSLVFQGNLPSPLLLVAFGYLLIVAWVLAALAYQRAADADINVWIAAAAFAPFLQIPVIVYLSYLPTAATAAAQPRGAAELRFHLPGFVYGVIACTGVTIAAVTLSTLLFSSYGVGIFLIAPFVIGAITAYLMNLRSDLGARNTNLLLAAATVMAAIGLVAVALEGIFCIILIAPLAFGLAVLGGIMGRAIANSTQRPPRQMLTGFAVLPLMFAVEALLPPETTFETRETITVSAPPAAVWASLLRMDIIAEPAALPFRLGVAHPIRGEVVGEGVGALRRGEFSTGIAIERVTEWVPERTLAFVVEQDVPAMRELSPYHHVHAPHATGYFRTTLTRFDLVPQPDGGTQIVEHTSHLLKLEPVLYWLPMVRLIVHMNNSRVLRHVKRQAEAAALTAMPMPMQSEVAASR